MMDGHGIVELEANSTSQPYRTGYHFQPAKNWMNDPNGPMIYKGIYHLFYQYNPKAAVWGNIVWGHSTSTDLVNWTQHEDAIYPSHPSDIKGCWSGSATILSEGQPAILYTGGDPNDRQVQNLAVPKNLSDPYLIEWVKTPKNPLIEPSDLIDPGSFRDPTTAWLGPDKRWRMIIGSQINETGIAILYTSRNFEDWIIAEDPLYSAEETGMWECLDFFPVSTTSLQGVDTSEIGPNLKHVFKASIVRTQQDCYVIGTYNITADKFILEAGSWSDVSALKYDYGMFYASKTFFDSAKNRRILWGWIKESSTEENNIKKGWAGLQGIPRSLWLDKSGKQLIQWPVVEIEKLRADEVKLPSKLLEGGSLLQVPGITAAQVGFSYICIHFRNDHNKYVVLMCSDQSRSSLDDSNEKTSYGAFLDVDPVHEKLSLRSLIDHSIVESFGGEGKACITARVYPTLAIDDNAHLYVFNYGTENVKMTGLSAWSMKKAEIN